jgi:uncharacterized cupin superfamily protein
MPRSAKIKSPALDPRAVAVQSGSGYPEIYRPVVVGRERRALGDEVGITHFGISLTRLKPGAASALRHWHTVEDEFVYILEGEVELVTNDGAQVLGPGMAAGFPAGKADGHHLVNRSKRDVLYLEIGDRRPEDEVEYPDVDLRLAVVQGKDIFVHKDGTPWKKPK